MILLLLIATAASLVSAPACVSEAWASQDGGTARPVAIVESRLAARDATVELRSASVARISRATPLASSALRLAVASTGSELEGTDVTEADSPTLDAVEEEEAIELLLERGGPTVAQIATVTCTLPTIPFNISWFRPLPPERMTGALRPGPAVAPPLHRAGVPPPPPLRPRGGHPAVIVIDGEHESGGPGALDAPTRGTPLMRGMA